MYQKDINLGNICEREDYSRPSPSKRLCPDSDGHESTIEVEISLLQSIDKRLAKLEILYVMREELGKLRASLEYSQMQIDLI